MHLVDIFIKNTKNFYHSTFIVCVDVVFYGCGVSMVSVCTDILHNQLVSVQRV